MTNFIDDLDLDSDSDSQNSAQEADNADDGPAAWDMEEDEDEKPKEEEKKPEPVPEPEEESKPKEKPKPEPKKEPKDQPKKQQGKKGKKGKQEEEFKVDVDVKLRSPICVIMGHVDTGKTKLLDKIRRTNVQTGEAGGITQQIGATYFPVSALMQKTQSFAAKYNLEYKLPGLLIIDTPGHESFSNLRSRGSSLCDVAILVVDIMHGIENQTIESINLLKAKKSYFIIALNKIDRISDWKPHNDAPFEETFRKQSQHAKDNFMKRFNLVQMQFQENGLNTLPYFKMNFNDKLTAFPICPTSAITGEGIPELLMLVQLVTQNKMQAKLASKDELQCTVLEVKIEEGIGTTLDVILVNGELHVNDTIVLAGINGPIVTHIRALLTPQPMRELRVRSEWVHHDVVYAAMGCKIAAPELDGAIAGSELFVAKNDDEIDEYMDMVNADVDSIYGQVDKGGEGVYVQASTLGSLEALLNHLKSQNIKASMVGIGPVHRKDVVAISHMVEKNPKYAVILAFDVPVTPEAKQAARELHVTIYEAQIIYHLTDQYEEYLKKLIADQKEKARSQVVFPASITMIDGAIFNRNKPIIIGVRVLEGTLRKGTPLVVIQEPKPLYLGTVESIKMDNKDVDSAPTNSEVSIQLKAGSDSSIIAGKDFKAGDQIVTRMNREIINLLKEHFRDDLKKEDWILIVQIKKLLHIQ
ncbi:Elongation factor Tu GTP binding domain containing protein [Tritrichomonas foetus]|uniref:Eukaryotic translation initiation factor 5B n=1 Tax=Tritrichomonas foetus TaxID=1144522 RepID=A0A1J4KAI1_9EUKA|nr:Elongation factor Tu GTP binding domain containing protein [Tritrichomonas foetus]|eukprot:OHT07920.1 Elongation factor Tu GTP binding domain containing protein [Tritrichomonas foetus]